jgi:hypothetical protein
MPLTNVRGNTQNWPLNFTTATFSYALTTSGVSSYPTVGDIYSVSNVILFVTSITSNVISFQSDALADVLATTGTLTKFSGTGDTTISYTTKTVNQVADITGMTVNFRVIRYIQDTPPSGDIILPTVSITNHILPKLGKTVLQLTGTQTASLEIGNFVGVLELVNSNGQKAEQFNEQTFDVTIQENKIP